MTIQDPQLDRSGARHFPKVFDPADRAMLSVTACIPEGEAGVRIGSLRPLRSALASDGMLGRIASSAIGPLARPVRALSLDKNGETNWSLAWHPDRTICVKQRLDVAGYGPGTIKAGMHHVTPPFDLLANMVTLRAHLDDVPCDNAPLLIAPGSHPFGRVPESEIDAVVRRCGIFACLAEAGDVWLYSTPILHASDRSARPTRRRVLQIDFAAEDLPGGLEWLGV